MAYSALLVLPNLNSRKIWLIAKSYNFYTVKSYLRSKKFHDFHTAIDGKLFDWSQTFWSHRQNFNVVNFGQNQIQIRWRCKMTWNDRTKNLDFGFMIQSVWGKIRQINKFVIRKRYFHEMFFKAFKKECKLYSRIILLNVQCRALN